MQASGLGGVVVSTLLVGAVSTAAGMAPLVHVASFGLKVEDVKVIPSVMVPGGPVPEKIQAKPGMKLIEITLKGRFVGPGRYTVATNLFSVQFEKDVSHPNLPADMAGLALATKETEIVNALFVAQEDRQWGATYTIEAPERYTRGETIKFVVTVPTSVEHFSVLVATPVGNEVRVGHS